MELDGQDKLCTFEAEDLRRTENVKYPLRIDDASKDAEDVDVASCWERWVLGLLPLEAKGSKLLCISAMFS